VTLSLAGKLLIALPSMDDPRFRETVILICSHNDEHAMGLVLNRAADGVSLPELLDQLGVDGDGASEHAPVLIGGPVGADRGFVLHSDDYDANGATISIFEGVCLTATREVLHAIASDDPPEQSMLALGYAGWTGGQLEAEIAANAWLLAEPDSDIVFDPDLDRKWSRALGYIGISAGVLGTGGSA
jgi:putative transcriptional regulator